MFDIYVIKEVLKMSDDKRREELKAKINEELDSLSIENLEKVVGGGVIKLMFKPYCKKCRIYFPVDRQEKTCSYCGGPLE